MSALGSRGAGIWPGGRAACCGLLVAAWLGGCGASQRPVVMAGGAFAACPPTPNCVSSRADRSDEQHYIAPWGADAASVLDLASFLGAQRRCEVVDQGADWVHATCRTAVLRFTDDVVLQLDGAQVQVRSASRVGRSDLGKNRSRIESFRRAWEAR